MGLTLFNTPGLVVVIVGADTVQHTWLCGGYCQLQPEKKGKAGFDIQFILKTLNTLQSVKLLSLFFIKTVAVKANEVKHR